MARKWGVALAAVVTVGMLVWLRPERDLTSEAERRDAPAAMSEPVTEPQTTDARARTTEREPARAEDAPREDWNERYLATDDFFEFVTAAAPAAIAGDARAQWRISRALLECQVELLAAKTEPKRYVPPDAPRLCERFYTAHPLDAFDLPAEAKSFTYWRDQALANGDALATTANAVSVFGRYEAERDPATKERLRQQVLAGIRVAIEARDPQAIMEISTFVYPRPATPAGVGRWMGWFVAACELGLDCNKPPLELARSCATSQICQGIQTVTDFIQSAPYPNESYVQGQDIAFKIKTGDWEGLQPYLGLGD